MIEALCWMIRPPATPNALPAVRGMKKAMQRPLVIHWR